MANSFLFSKDNAIPQWLRGWRVFWVISIGIYVIVYSSWIFLKWTDTAYESLITELGYLPLGIFSAVCAILVSRQPYLDRILRRAWGYIAMGIIFLAVADSIYVYKELTTGIEFPDFTDILYLAFYPLAFIGLVTLPVESDDVSEEKTRLFDLAIVSTSAFGISWYFIIAPTSIASGADLLTRIVAGAYPSMSVLLFAGVLSLLFRRTEINLRQSLYLLGLGLFIFALADIIYAWLSLSDLYESGSWVDTLWTVSYFLIGLAALRQATPYPIPGSKSKDAKERQLDWRSSILPFGAMLTSVGLTLYAIATGQGAGIPAIGLVFGTGITVFIGIIRQVITSQENERLVNDLNLALNQIRTDANFLEQRVAERTRELENQAVRLRITAEVTRDAASSHDMQEGLERFAQLLHSQFVYYHVHIFVVEENNNSLILMASSTESGQKMVERNFRLKVGGPSLVEKVAMVGESRISSNVEKDAVQDENILIPETQAIIALPLKSENRTVGILYIQSEQSQAFTPDEVTIMQIMADQLATAFERARLLQETVQNMQNLERVYGQYTRDSWNRISASSRIKNKGYRFDNVRIEPISEVSNLGKESLARGTIVNSNGAHAPREMALPIQLRGQTVGVVDVKLKEGYNESTIATLQQAIERLASAMESARLYEEASIRADREQAITHVTSAISSSTEYETIMRTTVQEIGNLLNDTEVAIRILDDIDDE